MIVLVFLVFVVIGFIIQYLYQRKNYYKFSESLPEPKSYGVLGHAPYFVGKDEEARLKLIDSWCQTYTKYFKLWLGPAILWTFVNDPRVIQKILLSPQILEKPFFYKFLRLENGLISAKFNVWKIHRKSLNYSFNLKILQSFVPIFVENSKNMVDKMMTYVVTKEKFDLLNCTTKCALSMICETSFGLDVKNFMINDDVFHALEKLNNIISARSHNFFLYPEAIYRLTKYYREEMENRNLCYMYSDFIIKEKREALRPAKDVDDDDRNNNNYNDNNNENNVKNLNIINMNYETKTIENDIPTRKIFIDHVICNETKFTDLEIRDHVYTVIAAGSETTALQSAHTLLLLAMHPEIQDKVASELKEVFYSDNVDFDYDNLSKCELLERVIKESLRLCPVVPIIGRETQTTVELDGHIIPAGITLLINFYSLHRRKDIWGDDADKFNPDHFLPENIEKRHPYSFLPFSGGQRNCIGYRYAMIAIKIIMIHLLKQFKFSTDIKYEDMRLRTDINLKLCTEHSVSIELRK